MTPRVRRGRRRSRGYARPAKAIWAVWGVDVAGASQPCGQFTEEHPPGWRPSPYSSPHFQARTAKPPRRGMHSPPMPASKPPCVATARSWPTAPAGDGRTQCDSMVCSTRPGRLPPVGSGLPAMRQPASLPSCHRPGRTGPGPLAARPGRERLSGPFLPLGRAENSQASVLYVLDQYYL